VDDIVKEFLIESNENLDRLDRCLVDLEKSPRDQGLLADIFRTIHSIKGTTGFLGFPHLEAVAHAGENLLTLLRDGVLLLNPSITSGLLAMVDAIREMLDLIDQTRSDGENDYADLIHTLHELQSAATHPGAVQAPPKPVEESAAAPVLSLTQEVAVVQPEAGKVNSDKMAATDGSMEPKAGSDVEVAERGGDDRRKEDVPVATDRRNVKDRREVSSADSAIRVDVALLERLMDLVGELVLTRNQIVQYAAGQRDSGFLAVSQRLNLVTSDMREIIMKTRMQPMQNVMGKFPRMVRDLALACDKQVRVELVGQETELDRTLLEAIKDPLTHLVRNAVDHGVEKAEARLAAGKPAEGCLTLRAYHEGGQVNIEVSDDGAGLNHERLLNKAIEKGLITRQQADRMNQHEVANLIFHPGFSTAEKVTNVSGRGVGMDVVKTNIEKVGGTVDVQSALGKGTTLRMKIPLTLAIIPVLIVRSAGHRFAIPQVSLLELVRHEAERAERAIEFVHGAPVYRLRGNLLPLLFLRNQLQLAQQGKEGSQETKKLNIVVLQVEGQQFGLVVDEIHDAEEIVVKPLGQHLKHISAFAGATVMGDGEVALILDVTGLAQGGHLLTEAKKAVLQDAVQETTVSKAASEGEKQEILLFRTANGRRTAVPLSTVDRLEEFKPEQFEYAGGQIVVQYRGELLPIANLSDKADLATATTEDEVRNVLVCSHQGRRMGIVVDQILDVADEVVSLESRWKDRYSTGSAVVHKHVTDFLDLETVLGSTGQQNVPAEAVSQ
jgi:two-component system, chemotaxis family, sensor kinase CheA